MKKSLTNEKSATWGLGISGDPIDKRGNSISIGRKVLDRGEEYRRKKEDVYPPYPHLKKAQLSVFPSFERTYYPCT